MDKKRTTERENFRILKLMKGKNKSQSEDNLHSKKRKNNSRSFSWLFGLESFISLSFLSD
jgi:hypothetical protein